LATGKTNGAQHAADQAANVVAIILHLDLHHSFRRSAANLPSMAMDKYPTHQLVCGKLLINHHIRIMPTTIDVELHDIILDDSPVDDVRT